MEITITLQELGRRIAELRKNKGYLQSDLAQRLSLSRSSLAQIESGNRNLTALELYKVSTILGVRMEELMSTDYVSDVTVEYKRAGSIRKETSRESLPTTDFTKFRNVILYILEQCAGKPNIGENELYTLLYFCDFNHYELYEEHLSGIRYHKTSAGPVPLHIDVFLSSLINENELYRINNSIPGQLTTRYIPLVKPDLSQLRASEKEVIDQVVHRMGNWSARTLQAYVRNDMPWQATREGDHINYELVFYREMPYSVREYDEEEI